MGIAKRIYTQYGKRQKGSPLFIVDQYTTQDMLKGIARYARAFEKESERFQVLLAASKEVVKEARKIRFKGKSRKRPYQVDPSVTIYPGNLAKSMKSYKSKKTGDVYVGPRYLKRITAKEMGRTLRTASGYYAAMLAGSAIDFRRMYMEPVLANSINNAFQSAEKQANKVHEKLIRKI